jgi:hypothetical protein
MLQNEASLSCALTFYSKLNIFSYLAIQNKVNPVKTRQVHNFHAMTGFLSMPRARLPASLEGCAGAHPVREVVRNREDVGNGGKLVGSGRTKGIVLGR